MKNSSSGFSLSRSLQRLLTRNRTSYRVLSLEQNREFNWKREASGIVRIAQNGCGKNGCRKRQEGGCELCCHALEFFQKMAPTTLSG
jgi:hypothetical protein